MNKGGVDAWLQKCKQVYPKNTKREILRLANEVPHTCLKCWWLQFKDGVSNRACRYDEFNKEKLPFRKVPEALTWVCLGWRVDPEARQRVGGFQGFIM